MDEKLQVLTEKIYKEGVEAAEKKSEEIILRARQKSDELTKKTTAEAQTIVDNARKEAETLKKNIEAELKLAGTQMMSAIKQEITGVITRKVADEGTGQAMDSDFVKTIISEVIKKWDPQSEGASLEVILADSHKDQIDEAYIQSLSEKIETISLTFDGKLSRGFKIKSSQKSYQLSFTDEDFAEFFKIYLRKKTYDLLFGK